MMNIFYSFSCVKHMFSFFVDTLSKIISSLNYVICTAVLIVKKINSITNKKGIKCLNLKPMGININHEINIRISINVTDDVAPNL